jgi:disulfide oxidoreductase YuzD
MGKDFITVKILDLPGVGSGCACSSTPRGPEYTQTLLQKCSELKEALEASYPGKTTTELIDLSESPDERETEAGQLLVTKKFPPPLVVINGEPRYAGSIQVNKILNEVKKILTA